MSNPVFKLLRAHDSAFRSGDRALHSAARADLKRRIKEGKADYRKKKETRFSNNGTRVVWQGLQNITNYRGCDMTSGVMSH